MKNYRHLFGPVPSRRLGRSLGVDLVPFKTCSFDCIFCQLGRTTNKTFKRSEYVSVSAVIEELDHWIEKDGVADYITLSGSGEPTLNSQFGKIIEFAQSATTIPVAVLTNGTTLSKPSVRTALAKANIVKLSLSAWDQFSFKHINWPCPKLNLKEMLEGMWNFRNEFKGKLWIEVFLVWGTNTISADVSRIASLVKAISPDRVQINTAVRPPVEKYALATPKKDMEKLAKLFEPKAEVIAEFSTTSSPSISANEDNILAMLGRRPCTSDQIEHAFGMHKNEVSKYLGYLLEKGKLYVDYRNHNIYHRKCFRKDVNHANV